MELGTPGSVMAVPAVIVPVSMGNNVGEVPLGGANELVAKTVEAGVAAARAGQIGNLAYGRGGQITWPLKP